ncbi:MAG: Bax inhibitor-1/YccA family protein [Alphaproteobacteria bacterium]
MAFGNDRRMTVATTRAEVGQIDEGLRAYMLRVYNYMTTGLAMTGLTAWLVANTALINLFYQTGPTGALQPTILAWVAMLAPLAFVFLLSARIERMSVASAQMAFWAFAVVMGLSLSHILLTFTGVSVARVFFITAATFAAMSLYGYTTKRDLSGLGSFLFMGLIGIIIASIVNIFLASSMMHWIISIVGVGVFVGLTAYDTQRIKETYYVGDDGEAAGRKAIMGALQLYLDFINLFVMLMQLLGDRK